MSKLARREFLKATPAAAGLAALAGGARTRASQTAPKDIRISSVGYTPRPDYPIQPQRPWAVTLNDGFWKPRVATNAAVTIPFQVRKLEGTGREMNGNLLEAATLSLRTHPDPALQAQVDATVARLLETPASGNSGFEAAVTRLQVTGRRDLLERAIRAADALYEDFRLRHPPFSGGERDAMNCVQLYRATHDRKHLDLAKHYLDIRGLENSVNRSRHNQSYKPVLEQGEAVGHAVNGVTLMVSLADVGMLTGIGAYFEASHRMWTDAVRRKMYVTGGVGTTGNEGFGEPYSLPNISAYAETCAVLMFITLNHRLFLATGDAQYIDVMERGMYNNAVDGVSLSGDRFFYVNRLASAGDGRDTRWAQASLECCPPNLVRFMAAMPGLVYAQNTATDAVYVNLYVSSATTFSVRGKELALTVDSEMPWGGRTRMAVSAREPVKAALKLRIPGWAWNRPAPGSLYGYVGPVERPPTVTVNGAVVAATRDQMGYMSIDRAWSDGDIVELRLAVEPRRTHTFGRVADTAGRVAIERGPLVYCAEWPDVEGGRALDLKVDRAAPLTTAIDNGPLGLPGSIVVIETEATSVSRPQRSAARARLVPYGLWANRGAGEMTVWLAEADYTVGAVGPAGGFIFYVNPDHARDGWRYLEAAPFDQSAGAGWGCFRRLIDGARGTAIGTGTQNTTDMVAACAEAGTAAQLCATLSVNGVRGWFLPSRDELLLMFHNLKAHGRGGFESSGLADNVAYWASSQQTADMSVHVDFADLGRVHGDDKDFPRRVRAVRAI